MRIVIKWVLFIVGETAGCHLLYLGWKKKKDYKKIPFRFRHLFQRNMPFSEMSSIQCFLEGLLLIFLGLMFYICCL